MTLVAAQVRAHRPLAEVVTISVLFFLGVTAFAGGVALVFGLGEGQLMLPADWLEDIPIIDSWVVPGLVLGIGFGLGSLITGYGMLRRSHWGWLEFVEEATGYHWSWLATILLGAGHLLWIALELIYLPKPSLLHMLYGVIALALLLLPFLPSMRQDLRVR